MNTYVKVSFRLWSCKFGGLKLVRSPGKKQVASIFILLCFELIVHKFSLALTVIFDGQNKLRKWENFTLVETLVLSQ